MSITNIQYMKNGKESTIEVLYGWISLYKTKIVEHLKRMFNFTKYLPRP